MKWLIFSLGLNLLILRREFVKLRHVWQENPKIMQEDRYRILLNKILNIMANNLLIYYVGQYVLYLILIMDIFNLENHGC